MQPVPPLIRFEGHAIVSADGMIADAHGQMPAPLRNDADWRLFQAALDGSAVVVVGRLGHERHPNPGRRRLVPTSGVTRLEPDKRDPMAHLWNPAGADIAEVLRHLSIDTGTVAVTGGKRVFDLFLPRYDAFILSETNRFALPGGTPAFSAGHPRQVLAAAGLIPASCETIDVEGDVSLTRWIRPPTPAAGQREGE